MVPPDAPQAVSIWLRNCYVARFGHPLTAFEGVPLALPWYLPILGFETATWHVLGPPVLPWYLPRPYSWFHSASKLPRGTFWAPCTSLKNPHTCFAMVHPEAPQAVSIGLRNCHVARFGHPLRLQNTRSSFWRPLNRKTIRSSLRWRRPACFAMVRPEAPQAVSSGLRNCHVAPFGHPLKASKPPQQLSKAFEPQNPPQQLAKASCLPRPHKLVLLGFETVTWHVLCTPLPQAAFEGVPRALPWYLPRPHKLFLLGFETATWHVLGTP